MRDRERERERRENLVEAIESEGEELGDVRLLGAGGEREEAGDGGRVLRRGIFGLHHLELRIRMEARIGPLRFWRWW